jgi:hypothetical protein
VLGEGDTARTGTEYGGEGPKVGPEAVVGDGVYAGGGSFEGTVKAFMPGRSRIMSAHSFDVKAEKAGIYIK